MEDTTNLRRTTRDLLYQLLEVAVAEKLIIREWLNNDLQLALAAPSELDRVLDDQTAALAEIRSVARRLGKEPGDWPTFREFTANADGCWTGKRVAEAFGRWSIAIDAINGRTCASAEQRAYLRKIAGHRHVAREEYESVRDWLATNPLVRSGCFYDAWARKQNSEVEQAEDWNLCSTTIMLRLGLAWSQIVRVTSGEISAEEAPPRTGGEKPTWSDGPHQFLGRREVADQLNLDYQVLRRRERNAAFPHPAIVLGNTPAWLPEQIDALKQKRPLPEVEYDSLRPEYLSACELAERLNVTPTALRQPKAHAPKPTGAICGKHVWYLSDVEAWEATTDVSPYSGRARRGRSAGG
jgi:hypothetical protein